MDRIEFESHGNACPDFADVLVERETLESLDARCMLAITGKAAEHVGVRPSGWTGSQGVGFEGQLGIQAPESAP